MCPLLLLVYFSVVATNIFWRESHPMSFHFFDRMHYKWVQWRAHTCSHSTCLLMAKLSLLDLLDLFYMKRQGDWEIKPYFKWNILLKEVRYCSGPLIMLGSYIWAELLNLDANCMLFTLSGAHDLLLCNENSRHRGALLFWSLSK